LKRTRREFLRAIGAAAIGAHLSGCSAFRGGLARKGPPNILFLMTDQFRHDALSCRGNHHVKTPVLDQLAKSGTLFSRTYCQNPVCSPARAAILFGRYTHSCGVKTNTHMAPRDLPTIPTALREYGYTTACFGKLHINGRDDLDWDTKGLKKNWPQVERREGEYYLGAGLQGDQPLATPAPFPIEYHPEWRAKEETIEFMEMNRRRPWFIQCSFNKPHPPFQPPRKHWDMIDRSKLEIPEYPEGDLDDANPALWNMMKGRKLDNITREDILDGMQGYYGNIACCDELFGEVLDALDRLGLRENTLIVFTADHGEMLHAHRLWTKFNFFEESVHVPLILSMPGLVPEDRVCDALIEQIDLFPTFMDVLGLNTPKEVQGRSFLPVAKGETEHHRDFVRSEFGGKMLMHFDGRYKFIDNGEGVIQELYDLQNDPREIENLANLPLHKARMKAFTKELRQWKNTDVVEMPDKNAARKKNPDADKANAKRRNSAARGR
jgi:choline-sulfatase